MTTGQKLWYGVIWVVATTIARTYFRAKVYGRENVPNAGSFIISPIHRSNLDTPLISLVLKPPRRMRYMGKESLWKNRFWAWFFSMAGGFPVARATYSSASNSCRRLSMSWPNSRRRRSGVNSNEKKTRLP